MNLSLLSKVMHSRLARGTYNGGLLSTEAGTLVTLVDYLGKSRLLNVTMLPNLLIGLLAIVGTVYTYDSMFYIEIWQAFMSRKLVVNIYKCYLLVDTNSCSWSNRQT